MKDVFTGKVSDRFNFFDLYSLKLECLMDCIPENLIITKDSGTWEIRDEEHKQLAVMDVNAGLKEMIVHFLLSIPYSEKLAWDIAEAIVDSNTYKTAVKQI